MTEETKNTEAEVATEETKEETQAAPAKEAEAPKEEAKESTESPADNQADKEKKEVEVPAKFKKIVEEIEGMSVLELNELVKVFEEKFGVSATAVAAAGPAAGGAEEEGSSTVNIELTDSGANKIAVIKVVKEVLGLGLKEAKDMVDGVPNMLKNDVKKEEADEIKAKVEEAGGKVTYK